MYYHQDHHPQQQQQQQQQQYHTAQFAMSAHGGGDGGVGAGMVGDFSEQYYAPDASPMYYDSDVVARYHTPQSTTAYARGIHTSMHGGGAGSSRHDWANALSFEHYEMSSCVSFDPFEELLWVGDRSGRITSFTHPDYAKFSSFRSFIVNEPVIKLLVDMDRVFSLTSGTVRCHKKGGILNMSFKDDRFDRKLLDMCFYNQHRNKIVLGGESNELHLFDVKQGKIVQSVETTDGTRVIKSGSSRFLCTGSVGGKLLMRDHRTMTVEHSFDVHSKGISDIDVKGDLLVTCGYSNRNEDIYVDTQVKVFDLRTMRLLQQVQFAPGPSLLKFHPLFSSMVAIVSRSGYFQFRDVQQDINTNPAFLVNENPQDEIASFDISSSAGLLSFGDSNYIHLWNSSQTGGSSGFLGPVNNFSQETEFPEPSSAMVHYDNIKNGMKSDYPVMHPERSALSSIPSFEPDDSAQLDTAREKQLLSTWPYTFAFMVGQQSPEIHSQILEHLENPSQEKPAQLKGRGVQQQHQQQQMAVEITKNPGLKRLEDGYILVESESIRNERQYHVLDIIPHDYGLIQPVRDKYHTQYCKFNKTRFVGLQNDWANSFVNSFLQVIYHVCPELRICLMNHICKRPYCVSCELGFLFYMMQQIEQQIEKQRKQQKERGKRYPDMAAMRTCLSTNFLRNLERMPETKNKGIFEAEKNGRKLSVSEKIQNLNRIVMERIIRETGSETHLYPSIFPYVVTISQTKLFKSASNSARCKLNMVDILFGADIVATTRCSYCNHENMVETHPYIHQCAKPTSIFGKFQSEAQIMFGRGEAKKHRAGVSTSTTPAVGVTQARMRHPTASLISKDDYAMHAEDQTLPQRNPFEEVLQQTLSHYSTSRKACTNCHRKAHMEEITTFSTLPNILNLEYSLDQDDLDWLRVQHTNNVSESNSQVVMNGDGTDAMRHSSYRSATLKKKQSASKKKKKKKERISLPPNFVVTFEHEMGDWNVQALYSEEDEKLIAEQIAQQTFAKRTVYELRAIIAHVKHPFITEQDGNLVSLIKIPRTNQTDDPLSSDVGSSRETTETEDSVPTVDTTSQNTNQPPTSSTASLSDANFGYNGRDYTSRDWFLFNEFSVKKLQSDALNFSPAWKSPCTLVYRRRNLDRVAPKGVFQNPVNIKNAFGAREDLITNCREDQKDTEPLDDLPKKGDIVAIDSEFVLLEQKSQSVRKTTQPIFSLGRVSVIRESDETPFIDEHVALASSEKVLDYLTRYSGIEEGDLDPEVSRHKVVHLKDLYIKLRALVDRGVIFVGHGLQTDFKIINLVVPPEQIIDTVEIYRLPRQRLISLRFLAKHLLNVDIQQETHDSIIDAKISLRLYKLYLEMVEKNEFESTLENIYSLGRKTNWSVDSPSDHG